jgi:hypothetical protein
MVSIKGHFDGKVFVPDEPVDLPRGQSVTVLVDSNGDNEKHESATQHPLDLIAETTIDDPALPVDGSQQHDHYLYGCAKRRNDE